MKTWPTTYPLSPTVARPRRIEVKFSVFIEAQLEYIKAGNLGQVLKVGDVVEDIRGNKATIISIVGYNEVEVV